MQGMLLPVVDEAMVKMLEAMWRVVEPLALAANKAAPDTQGDILG
jgi:hypothetical protein